MQTTDNVNRGGMSSMNMSKLTPTDNLPQAENAKYPAGTPVEILATHMQGMKGAHGSVTGVFDCAAYEVDVTSASGKVFKNHKWIISEEVKDGRFKTFHVGDKVILSRGHIESMAGKNAVATIVSIHKSPVYMIDFEPTNGGEEVRDHQWVVEDELASL